MSIDINTVTTFTRQNTGSHMLDSGGIYGRIWQSPAPTGKFSVSRDGTVSLTLTGLLVEHASLVSEIQEAIEAALAGDDDLTWFESGPRVMEERGYRLASRDNTYNGENDLDQNFVWEVWQLDEVEREWLYDDDAVVLVYAHTGCDVRGGYSRPIAVRFEGEYALPVDLVVGFYAASGEVESWMTRHGFSEDAFSQGYSSCPHYRLTQAVGAFVEHDPVAQTITFENPHYEEGSDEPETIAFVYEHWV
jgi:hypothetical protein